ncbi:transcription termination/antitermination NusG family protein [Microvirga sp. BSC39]|uniref:transcription termination/antitermination NusG family protein n=1 Tax=Microvirga sp. BSC39 TaxID=1549810 RepID=UPI0004E8E6BE|nr:transcription termination/antitermination NusG family protein [Microvirga sp. BSC39]KFG68689.1 hypothetical protein JH26_14535 [Microvirga sp. BSC39]
MAKKNRRKRHNRQRLETPKVTPTHFVRLERLKVVIDENLRWYVVRVDAKREGKVKQGLEAAGFATYQPVDVRGMGRAKGKTFEIKQRPAAGYLFVGLHKDRCGHEDLWAYHDRAVAADKPFTIIDQQGQEVVYDAGTLRERPFYRVMGPFGSKQLQRFADKISGPLVAALWSGDGIQETFPATVFDIVEGETLLLTNSFDRIETLAA